MASCRDPYRELEIYLEQAEEEIGKAFEELLQSESNSSPTSCGEWRNGETVLPPPPGFSSSTSRLLCCSSLDRNKNYSNCYSNRVLNRVCYDGNILDLQNGYTECPSSDRQRLPLRKSISCNQSESYFSKIGTSIGQSNMGRYYPDKHHAFSSPEKQFPKQLRSSLSFPEGAMDSVLRNTVSCWTPSLSYNGHEYDPSQRSNRACYWNSACEELREPLSLCSRKRPSFRQRSYSTSSSPPLHSEENCFDYPGPPTDDVNSLSIWADNLVIAIDKTLSSEFDGYTSGSSPLSEYGLSPTKNDDETAHSVVDAKMRRENGKEATEVQQSSLPSAVSSLKFTAPSPDSGIGQACDTPDAYEDTVDCSRQQAAYRTEVESKTEVNRKRGGSLKSSLANGRETHDTSGIHPDSVLKCESSQVGNARRSRLSSKRDAETQVNRQVLQAANSVTYVSDGVLLGLDNRVKEIHRNARVVPMVSVDLEDCATVTTTTCVAEAPWKGALFNGVVPCNDSLNDDSSTAQEYGSPSGAKSSASKSSSDVFLSASEFGSDSVIEPQSPEHCEGTPSPVTLATLPKHAGRLKEAEHFCSLPRDTGRSFENNRHDLLQRSSSSSAVSSVSQVSMDELAAFMRKVKTSTYHPPPRVDVSVDVKNDSDDALQEESNRDAVTQTTPVVPLSRSSSFTWVTECDCSDWDSSNARSGSEGSLLMFSHSNSASENKPAQVSSSTSLSTDDDDGLEVPQNSYCSSLYLSACTEASDSSITDSSTEGQAKRKPVDPPRDAVAPAERPEASTSTQSIKTSFAGAAAAGATDEMPANETVSLVSAASSQSDGTAAEQSASFPSTLKPAGRARSSDEGSGPGQPIEANVLVVNELNVKSVSAPVLRPKRQLAQKGISSSPPGGGRTKEPKSKSQPPAPHRAHSASELSELQAIEACSWLRAAGFPQYAQMYEDNLFPIDICTVQKDHAFLQPDSMQSLFRRLNTLNRCARMKFDTAPRTSFHLDESDDEEECALSENWEFQRVSRRWSRVPSPTHSCSECNASIHDQSSARPSPHSTPSRKFLTPEEAYCSSHDSVFADEQHSSPDSIRRCAMRRDEHYLPVQFLREGGYSPGSSSGSGGTLSVDPEDTFEKAWDMQQKDLHRSGSDRIKEGAKALLKRMESLKGRKKKKGEDGRKSQNMPSTAAGANSGTDGSSCSSLTSSPMINRQFRMRVTGPCDRYTNIQGGTPQLKPKKRGFGLLHKGDKDAGAHSDSECPVVLVSEPWKNDNSSSRHGDHSASRESVRTGSPSPVSRKGASRYLSVKTCSPEHKAHVDPGGGHEQMRNHGIHRCPHVPEEAKTNNRASQYDNYPAPLVAFNNACVENLDHSPSARSANSKDPAEQINIEADIIIISNDRRDSGVGASLTRVAYGCAAPWHSFPQRVTTKRSSNRLISITELTAPQMLILRKLSLLKLTTLMEKFSPSSRTGWSWVVPKFIRRIRTPDYKDKVVFGVPLLLVLQRTGEPLPVAIQAAIHYLRKTALDSAGLFRKSGVRSRIQKLRNLSETNSDHITYEDQQAYDVADMLKQYFRELPEALFTNKLSETFITIFQYIPEEMRLEAIQAAVFLMPDENREVLLALLSFLQEVCQHSGENQMTATNLAVCFAPSLFQLSSSRSASSSPRRRKTVGAPDLKELNENRAAYECLSCMVTNYKQLCVVSENLFLQSRLSCMDSYEPAHLGDLGNLVCRDAYGWKIYVECCVQTLMKEARDKYRGWDNMSQSDGVDLAYKKVGDGYPLRLWKASTEVEAPPTELLNRILRERHVWDSSFIKWRVVQTLEKQAEVFQFTCSSLPPHPPCEYCVIRAWKTDLPKGACVLIEASVEHNDAKPMVDGGVKALILTSRFLIEPCGSGKSRITHFSRVDTRGRSPEWYNRAYGYICTLNLIKLRDSFSHVRAGGPETKV